MIIASVFNAVNPGYIAAVVFGGLLGWLALWLAWASWTNEFVADFYDSFLVKGSILLGGVIGLVGGIFICSVIAGEFQGIWTTGDYVLFGGLCLTIIAHTVGWVASGAPYLAIIFSALSVFGIVGWVIKGWTSGVFQGDIPLVAQVLQWVAVLLTVKGISSPLLQWVAVVVGIVAGVGQLARLARR